MPKLKNLKVADYIIDYPSYPPQPLQVAEAQGALADAFLQRRHIRRLAGLQVLLKGLLVLLAGLLHQVLAVLLHQLLEIGGQLVWICWIFLGVEEAL